MILSTKHHLDVMGAFSCVIGNLLFLQCGFMFGSDFSPAIWKPRQHIAEQLGLVLLNDKSLWEKHKLHLNNLKWDNNLQNQKNDHSCLPQGTHINKGSYNQMVPCDPHHSTCSLAMMPAETSIQIPNMKNHCDRHQGYLHPPG